MGLQVVGAGLGRTGTHSLKVALEQLLGGPCYHMIEVFGRPEDIPVWHDAARGKAPDWRTFLAGYDAAVDWPAAAFWQELSEANPEAVILLSVRDADGWWRSADRTIFEAMRRPPPEDGSMDAWRAMAEDSLAVGFVREPWNHEDEAKAAFERHNEHVRATAPLERLVEWHPGDGWAPICDALDVPVPEEPFPHVNTTDEFRALAGLDDDSRG